MKKTTLYHRRTAGRKPLLATTFILICLSVVTIFFAPVRRAVASDPGAATLNPTGATPVTWNGTALGGGALNAPLVLESEALCQEGITCDTFNLTLSGTPADWAGKLAHIKIEWLSPTSDYDMYVHQGSVNGPVVQLSGNGATNPTGPLTSEEVTLNPSNPDVGTGLFAVRVVYYAATAADQYKGTARVISKPAPTPTPTPGPPSVSTEPPPRFFNYADPGGHEWGEPTLGVNFKSGKVMFVSATDTLRVTFDDSSSPAKALWEDRTFPYTGLVTWDPILFTDRATGRTYVSQLQFPTKQSTTAYTDDDGESWMVSQGSGINSGVDHQTIGVGPYAKNADGTLKGAAIQRPGPDGKIYPNAVYYASQDIGLAEVARSDDGGFTFGLAVPMYDLTKCGGLHGQIKVAPDGTVYVPNKACGGQQAVVVSEDNGITWEVRKVPGSRAGSWDPAVGIGEDGTLYFGYADANTVPRVAVSKDRGRTWIYDRPVASQYNFTALAFPAVVAGDGDRAAIAFLGTTTDGLPLGTGTSFTGTWHLFVSATYDTGQTWALTDATPTDPVQRGNICDAGTGCPDTPKNTRNLLDFMGINVDAQGRILVGYADGCVTAQCIMGADVNGDGKVNALDNDAKALSAIARQSGGKGLFKRFDTPQPNVPAPPALVAELSGQIANLAWSVPDNGGSPITGYKVYRGNVGGSASLLASVAADATGYTDANSRDNVYYQVRAVNAVGDGVLSLPVSPKVLESPCKLPGVTVVTDASDALPNAPLIPPVDIKSLQIAEPYANGASKLVFTVKVGVGAAPPNSQWYVIWQRPQPDANHDRNYVAMKSDLLGALKFEHGRVSYPLVYTSPAPNQGNLPTKFGDVEGSFDPVNGIIRITVSNDKVDNPVAGQTLVGLEVRSFLGRNDALPINQNLSSDFAATGTYQVRSNDSCLLPPAAPTGLLAVSPRKGEINLTWVDNSGDEDSFIIERSTSPTEGFAPVATVGSNIVNYADRMVMRKVTYYYRVQAAKGVAKSGYSNIASAKTK